MIDARTFAASLTLICFADPPPMHRENGTVPWDLGAKASHLKLNQSPKTPASAVPTQPPKQQQQTPQSGSSPHKRRSNARLRLLLHPIQKQNAKEGHYRKSRSYRFRIRDARGPSLSKHRHSSAPAQLSSPANINIPTSAGRAVQPCTRARKRRGSLETRRPAANIHTYISRRPRPHLRHLLTRGRSSYRPSRSCPVTTKPLHPPPHQRPRRARKVGKGSGFLRARLLRINCPVRAVSASTSASASVLGVLDRRTRQIWNRAARGRVLRVCLNLTLNLKARQRAKQRARAKQERKVRVKSRRWRRNRKRKVVRVGGQRAESESESGRKRASRRRRTCRMFLGVRPRLVLHLVRPRPADFGEEDEATKRRRHRRRHCRHSYKKVGRVS